MIGSRYWMVQFVDGPNGGNQVTVAVDFGGWEDAFMCWPPTLDLFALGVPDGARYRLYGAFTMVAVYLLDKDGIQ